MGDEAFKLLRKHLLGMFVAKVMHFAAHHPHVTRYLDSMADVLAPAYQCLRDGGRI